MIEIVSADDPESPEPLGTIELASMDDCEYAWVDQLFAIDNHVFVVQTVDGWDMQGNYESTTRVLSFDISVDSALRTALVTRGLARAKTFSWERTAAETLALLTELVAP